MKLYYHPYSANCRRVLATMHQLEMKLDIHQVDFESGFLENAEFRKINPNGMIPALVDGNFSLWESNAIMVYLAEKSGNTSFYPKDAQARADIMRWQSWELSLFGPACGTFLFENVIKGMVGMGAPDPAALEQGAKEVHVYGKVLDAHLKNHDYLVGNQLTLADYSVAAAVTHAPDSKLPLAEFPNIQKWYARVAATPGWKRAEAYKA